ncbi:hypothetical protein SERLADRAFT_409726 [Serpula lacrymans var. lacrymans S7.9]|uniref:Uncharacterized protein n=1 Tax=Serpula lacrymans var. lacrymans (strain S7.9) TaxID=578457 RepID=F8P3J3_SERL9|nr:uncharacterized protein SERLADRAFT_409726 [Serpula lacrymans var. lacrymans S7.9]EGO22092.1 hypothetical protein SERLADRAFT_409726 [Serpula lacrymans var. lacrymans S7.9]
MNDIMHALEPRFWEEISMHKDDIFRHVSIKFQYKVLVTFVTNAALPEYLIHFVDWYFVYYIRLSKKTGKMAKGCTLIHKDASDMPCKCFRAGAEFVGMQLFVWDDGGRDVRLTDNPAWANTSTTFSGTPVEWQNKPRIAFFCGSGSRAFLRFCGLSMIELIIAQSCSAVADIVLNCKPWHSRPSSSTSLHNTPVTSVNDQESTGCREFVWLYSTLQNSLDQLGY